VLLVVKPKDVSPDKVALYIRWSTDDQGEGTTLETQLERCKHYLISQGWQFNADLVYIDDGFSGGSLDRPAITLLRKSVEERKVECVVVYKIDRLSRSVVDIVDLVLREWEGRCFVKSTSEDINTLTPAGKMFFYILVSFAEYERNVIRERTMGGKIKRAEQGLNPGFRPPFGYTKGRTAGSIEVVEHEAGLVRRMYAMYRRGNGPYQISQALNSEGLTKRGNTWSDLGVRRILTNPAYIGVLEYGRTMRTTKEQRERQGLKSLIRFEHGRFARTEGAFTPIVDRTLWDEVQAIMLDRSTQQKLLTKKPTYSEYLLSGVATCRCGSGVHGKNAREGHRYYYCTARKRFGSFRCNAGYLPLREVDAAIEERLKRLLSVEGKLALAQGLEEELDERIAGIQRAMELEEEALQGLGERQKRLERDYRTGELPAKIFAVELEVIEQDQLQSGHRAGKLTEHLAGLQEAKRQSESILSTVDMVAAWDDLNTSERKKLLQKLTQSIVMYRPVNSDGPVRLEITWIKTGVRTTHSR
jgi:site-specific DNA recombinase